MKVHWLIKYYAVAFICIFSIVYLLKLAEPKVNWLLYEKGLDKILALAILNNDCLVLKEEYQIELNKNYKESFFGLIVKKDRRPLRGLNLLNYLNYHLKKINCDRN